MLHSCYLSAAGTSDNPGEKSCMNRITAHKQQPSHLGPAATVGGVRLRLELSALQSLAASDHLNVISSRDFQTSDCCHYLSWVWWRVWQLPITYSNLITERLDRSVRSWSRVRVSNVSEVKISPLVGLDIKSISLEDRIWCTTSVVIDLKGLLVSVCWWTMFSQVMIVYPLLCILNSYSM